MASRRARPRKLNVKQVIQIFNQSQVDVDFEDDTNHEAERETGVDKSEAHEYHLLQVIKASQGAVAEAAKVSDAYIPTPPIIASSIDYNALYRKGYRQPATYIRSSATVEDCAGSPYCMDEDDEIALKLLNAQLPEGVKECSEDVFEDVISFFEETAQTRQPFAAVDSSPVLPLEELEDQYDSTVPGAVRIYAKFIYEHWKSRRTATGNREITPGLKGETGADTDDADPYVCFRRREARQVRKTRNRDAHSAEKLRTLRLQLETAREILQQVKRRETYRKLMLDNEQLLFKQRQEVKTTKRKLGIKGDDEDLVNQKKPRKETHLSPAHAAQLQQQMRLPLGRGGPADELRSLEDWTATRQREIEKEIQTNIEKHINWNKGYVDMTRAPLTPVSEKNFSDRSKDFRQAMPVTEYLPTPPASVSDEEPDVDMADGDAEGKHTKVPTDIPFRYQSPDPNAHLPSFRTRIGRGGRLLVDRRNLLSFRPKEPPDRDHFAFDSDEDIDDVVSEDDDDFDRGMHERAFLFGKAQNPDAAHAQAARRAQLENGGSHRSPPQPHSQSSVGQQAPGVVSASS